MDEWGGASILVTRFRYLELNKVLTLYIMACLSPTLPIDMPIYVPEDKHKHFSFEASRLLPQLSVGCVVSMFPRF